MIGINFLNYPLQSSAYLSVKNYCNFIAQELSELNDISRTLRRLIRDTGSVT